MTQVARNTRYLENNGLVKITIGVSIESQKLKELHDLKHAEIYEAGIKYLIELNGKSQHSENIS